MAKIIKKESNKDLLTLGEQQVKIQAKKEKRKDLILPIILTIVGATLMIIGLLFNNIIDFLGINVKQENKEVIIKNDNILKCKKKVEDNTLGLITKTEYSYIFQDKKLKKLKEVRTIEPIEYSDIGPNNIRVINGQYSDLLEGFTDIEGLNVKQSLINNKLVISINIDLKTLNITQIPKNNKINVINTLDESSKSVKQKLAHSGDVLCE